MNNHLPPYPELDGEKFLSALITRMDQRGTTAIATAEQSGIKLATLKNILRCEADPGLKTFVRICAWMNQDAHSFFRKGNK